MSLQRNLVCEAMLSLERARAFASDKRGEITSRRRPPPATSEPDSLMDCRRGSDFQHSVWRRERVVGGEKLNESSWPGLSFSFSSLLSKHLPAFSSLFSLELHAPPAFYSTAQTPQCTVKSALPDDKVALVLNPTAPSMLCPQHVTDLVWQRLGSHLIIHLDRVFWPSSYTTVLFLEPQQLLESGSLSSNREGGLG